MAGNLRGPLVAAVRRDLAAARASVRSALAAATAAHHEAAAQREAVTAHAPHRHESLAAERDAAVAAATDRLRHETSTLAEALTALAASAAPGAAGLAWSAWHASPSSSPAGLLRIGSLEHQPPLPALMPLLDVAHLALSGPDQSTLDAVITGLLLRTLGSVPTGGVRLWIFQPGRLDGTLAGFAPLAPPGIVRFIGPGGLTRTLNGLAVQIQRINETVLGDHPSIAAASAALGRRTEPWRILVLLADERTRLSSAQRAALDLITRTGVAAGVHVVARGVALAQHDSVQTVSVAADGSAVTSLTGELRVLLDPPPVELVTWYAKQQAAGPPPATLDSLRPDKLFAGSSAAHLRTPIGEGTDGGLVDVVLDDQAQHALIGGPPGSGKTNLLSCLLAGLATRYSPDELELYLLGFAAPSFARFAATPRDPSRLPQARLIGVNIDCDREMGPALLRHLDGEVRRRADAARHAGATSLAELRAADPNGHWPRIVAVIDDFPVLLGTDDAITADAIALLEAVTQHGPSQGIHLVLAGQDAAEALSGHPALLARFTLRIALPKEPRMLAETNLAAELIPRHHAVVNADRGAAYANRVVRLPDAGERTRWELLQTELVSLCDTEPPHLFDGAMTPAYPVLPTSPPDFAREGAVALLGERVDVLGRPAAVRFTPSPGRNLAVLGTQTAQACSILSSAGRALARQHEPGGADFYVACFDTDAAVYAKTLAEELPASWHDSSSFVELLERLSASTRPAYLFCYALDAVSPLLAARRGTGRPTGRALLRSVLDRGPRRRTHTLAWWRSVAGLRDDLGGARLDAIGAWVALDVNGAELAPLGIEPDGPGWSPRPRRGLFFDRAAHRVPEILIPYEAEL